jgi:hypothetical protein
MTNDYKPQNTKKPQAKKKNGVKWSSLSDFSEVSNLPDFQANKDRVMMTSHHFFLIKSNDVID